MANRKTPARMSEPSNDPVDAFGEPLDILALRLVQHYRALAPCAADHAPEVEALFVRALFGTRRVIRPGRYPAELPRLERYRAQCPHCRRLLDLVTLRNAVSRRLEGHEFSAAELANMIDRVTEYH